MKGCLIKFLVCGMFSTGITICAYISKVNVNSYHMAGTIFVFWAITFLLSLFIR